jgi:protein SCO1/2
MATPTTNESNTRRETPPPGGIAARYPNVELTNHRGERLRFRDTFVDGRALVISAIYTRCQGSCPGTSFTIERLRDTLGPVFGERLTFVSFTIDPTVDTPEVLARYAANFGVEGPPARERPDWQFLTGSPDALDELRRGLGFFDLNPRVDRDKTRHAALLLFGNSTSDRWAALPSNLRDGLLVETIRRIAGFTWRQRYGIPA